MLKRRVYDFASNQTNDKNIWNILVDKKAMSFSPSW